MIKLLDLASTFVVALSGQCFAPPSDVVSLRAIEIGLPIGVQIVAANLPGCWPIGTAIVACRFRGAFHHNWG